jgi:hypothetical protein
MHCINTKSFLLFTIASSTLYSAAIATECEELTTTLITFGDICFAEEGSDQCPASCQEGLDKLYMTCTLNITYEPELILAALFYASKPCEAIVEKIIIAQTANTCQSWGTLYLSTSFLFCDDDTTCSQFCKEIQDGLYGSCASDDKILTKDSDSGKMSSTPVSMVVAGADLDLGDACKEYADGKVFSSSSALSISTISFIVSLVVSSFCLFAYRRLRSRTFRQKMSHIIV